MRLRDICDTQSGYSAAKGIEEVSDGGTPVVQMKDVRDFGPIGSQEVRRAKLEDVDARYLLRDGDVLFRPRGMSTTAAYVDGLRASPALIAPMIRLRPKSDIVLPAYLAWFINQPPAQRHFDACARGTNMRMVPKTCLEDLEVALPDIETQRRIIAMHELVEREAALLAELTVKRRMLTSFALLAQARKTQPLVGAGS